MILDIRFDFDRQNRLGLIEAIWGEHKSVEQLKKVAQEVLNKGEFVFITKKQVKLYYLLNGRIEACGKIFLMKK